MLSLWDLALQGFWDLSFRGWVLESRVKGVGCGVEDLCAISFCFGA